MAKLARYDELLPRIAAQMPAFHSGIALNALRRAGREFFRSAEAWHPDLDAIDVVADQEDYTLVIDAPAEIKRIKAVHLKTDEDVDEGYDGRLLGSGEYSLILPATLRFQEHYTPSAAVTDGLVVELVLFPYLMADELPDDLLERWVEPVIAWALYDLLKVQDPDLAGLHLQTYRNYLGDAQVENIEDPTP